MKVVDNIREYVKENIFRGNIHTEFKKALNNLNEEKIIELAQKSNYLVNTESREILDYKLKNTTDIIQELTLKNIDLDFRYITRKNDANVYMLSSENQIMAKNVNDTLRFEMSNNLPPDYQKIIYCIENGADIKLLNKQGIERKLGQKAIIERVGDKVHVADHFKSFNNYLISHVRNNDVGIAEIKYLDNHFHILSEIENGSVEGKQLQHYIQKGGNDVLTEHVNNIVKVSQGNKENYEYSILKRVEKTIELKSAIENNETHKIRNLVKEGAMIDVVNETLKQFDTSFKHKVLMEVNTATNELYNEKPYLKPTENTPNEFSFKLENLISEKRVEEQSLDFYNYVYKADNLNEASKLIKEIYPDKDAKELLSTMVSIKAAALNHQEGIVKADLGQKNNKGLGI